MITRSTNLILLPFKPAARLRPKPEAAPNRLKAPKNTSASLQELRSSSHITRFPIRSSAFEPLTADDKDRLLPNLTDALLLAYFACQSQSLFALECLVHTVAALYQQGCPITKLQVSLSVKPIETGASLLNPVEQDLLLAQALLVMMTLQKTGKPFDSDEAAPFDQFSNQSRSMEPFVDQVLRMIRSGDTVATLIKTQEEANSGGDPTSTVKVMQLNSLIVALAASLPGSETGEGPSDAAKFVASFDRDRSSHALALKSFIGFMGAIQGSVFCTDRFISAATEAYSSGWTAKQLVKSISEEEYDQACTQLPVMNASTAGMAAGISRQLFGRWVSIVFMTLARSGESHQLSAVETGWDWAFDVADDSGMQEMSSMSDFVANSLRRVMAEDSELDLSDRLQNIPDLMMYMPEYREEAEERKAEEGETWVTVEDEELGQTSPTALAFWQMIFLVHLTYRKLATARELAAGR